MIILVSFFFGVGVGALLAMHLNNMAELKRKAAEYDRLRRD